SQAGDRDRGGRAHCRHRRPPPEQAAFDGRALENPARARAPQPRSAAQRPPRTGRDDGAECSCPGRGVPRDRWRDRPNHDQTRRNRARRHPGGRRGEVRPSHPRDRRWRESRRSAAVRPARRRPRHCGIAAGMTAMQEPRGGAKLLIDLGPLLVFFLVNFLAPVPAVMKIFVATGAFMIAMVVAMIFSALRYQRISPLLWFSGIMVVVLGGLTIWLHDETFIKMKPTLYYVLVSGLLFFGLATDRPLLQGVLGGTYPGLDTNGWKKLTRNW